ncbi:nuclear transport factor 2 family protein [Thalassotalea euphylliae]|nr:nuclear transport factor 2 family protein [Thalassotalea euphylliae]
MKRSQMNSDANTDASTNTSTDGKTEKATSASSKEIVKQWVAAFNAGDAELLSSFYHSDAVNHQVANEPVVGKQAIYQMFREEFANAEMVCIVDNIFQDGEWAILEWKDPIGLRGCGFFHIQNGLIVMQRGYWDKLSFLQAHNLPIPSTKSPSN